MLAAGFHVLSVLTSSLVCQVGTFSSLPLQQRRTGSLNRHQRERPDGLGNAHPCMASMGVSTRFDMKRSLSSGVKDVSRSARSEGSMKCADLVNVPDARTISDERTQSSPHTAHLDCISGTYACALMYAAAGTTALQFYDDQHAGAREQQREARRTSDDPVRKARGEVPCALAPVRMAEDEHLRVRREPPRAPPLGAREDPPERVHRLPRVLRAGPVPVESLRRPRQMGAVHHRAVGGRELTQDVRPAGITTQLRFCRGIASAQKESARTSTPAPSAPYTRVRSAFGLCARGDGEMEMGRARRLTEREDRRARPLASRRRLQGREHVERGRHGARKEIRRLHEGLRWRARARAGSVERVRAVPDGQRRGHRRPRRPGRQRELDGERIARERRARVLHDAQGHDARLARSDDRLRPHERDVESLHGGRGSDVSTHGCDHTRSQRGLRYLRAHAARDGAGVDRPPARDAPQADAERVAEREPVDKVARDVMRGLAHDGRGPRRLERRDHGDVERRGVLAARGGVAE